MDVTNTADYDPNDRFHTLLRGIYHKKRDEQARDTARQAVRDDDEGENVDTGSNTSSKRVPRSRTAGRSASTTSKRAVRSTQTKSTARKATSTAAPKSSPRSQRSQSSPRDAEDDGLTELDNNGSSSSDSDAEFSPPSAIKTRTSTRGRSRGRARRAPTTNTTAADTDMNSDAGPPMGTFSPRTSRSRPRRQPKYNHKPTSKPDANPSGTDGANENDKGEYGSSTDEETMISVPKAYFKELQRETLWRRDAMAKAGLDGDSTGNDGTKGKGGARSLDFVRD